MRGWKNIFQANGKQKTAGVAILITHKINLKIKKINVEAVYCHPAYLTYMKSTS